MKESHVVLRPAAILRQAEANKVVAALEGLDVSRGGVWNVGPGLWQRYDKPWDGPAGLTGSARLLGTVGVIYGSPSRYEITIFRVTVTNAGAEAGWTVESVCDEALGYCGLNLARCSRAELVAPPTPDPFHA